jgi:hypothetical protein
MSLKKEIKVGAVQTSGATPTNITGCAVAVPDNKEGSGLPRCRQVRGQQQRVRYLGGL